MFSNVAKDMWVGVGWGMVQENVLLYGILLKIPGSGQSIIVRLSLLISASGAE